MQTQAGNTTSRPMRVALIALSILHGTAALVGAQDTWSDEYDQQGLLGRAYTVTTYQGDLIVGGPGAQADGSFFGFTARFDGTRWQPMGDDIYSNSGNPYVRHHVGAYTEYQGELIAGGHFTSAGGKPASSVARWDGTQWYPLGGGVAGIVHAAAVYQGELYVAGEFTSAGGQPASNIARWNGSSWQDVGGGLDKSFDPEVHDLVVGPDDRLYASGEFDTAGGATAFNIAVWDGASWSPLGVGLPGALNARVRALLWHQGLLYAGGNFDLIPGGKPHQKVASWDGTSWQAAGNFPDGAIVGTAVNELVTYGQDLYACGNLVSVDGVPVTRMARFDGSSWSDIGGISGSDVETDIWGATVYAGKLVVAGEFTLTGTSFGAGEPLVAQSVAAYTGSSWENVGTGFGFDGAVNHATWWNGGVVAVGGFTQAGSQFTSGPDLWSGPVFSAGGDWASMGSFKGQCMDAMEWNGDLIVGGEFTQVDGQPIAGVARFDGTQWTGFGAGSVGAALAVYQGQLYAGGIGGVKRWNGSSWELFAAQLFGNVSVMHVHQDVLYIGGSFASFDYLVSWDGTTQQGVGTGGSGLVSTLASYQGDLLVGGWFGLDIWDGASYTPFPGITGPLVSALTIFQGELHAGGVLLSGSTTPPKKYIARWDGSKWKPLGGGVDGQPLTLVADDAGGHLYAGGALAQADGSPSRWFARWDTQPSDGLGTIYCSPANPNSTGWPAFLAATGSPAVADNDVTFTVTGLPSQQFGYFLMSQTQASIPVGDGVLCLGSPLGRFNSFVLNSGAGGAVTFSPDLASGLPFGFDVDPGETWNFQLWYRDGPKSNFSDAVSIPFE